MTLRSPMRQTLVPQVIEQLRTQISSGEWPVGSRIPTEPDLAAALGVGRNTVREAVRALVHAGVLECRQGSGTYVTATHELTGVVARRLVDAEMAEAVEVRRAFEVEAARLAAQRRTPADLDLLDELLARREQCWADGDAAAFVAADADLHMAIVTAAHNAMLAELYASFGTAMRASLSQHFGGRLTEERYTDHGDLVEAIRAADPTRAARAAAAYLDPA
ncbi:FadR/GntR family transcriptional regulator [Catellatospora tritici]|uniref:FadR/GntR family transcriptional regulator n=1 Tax=Catellatospora tritici TaxID=2851566 RepID=UPI001C2D1BAA|nr:FCD domain-containing protein [Catellatospora tritici]MBV1852982.1 FCD domain-containing protein [Catellatospora tritici]